MKTVLSSLVALAVLAGLAAPASAQFWNRKGYGETVYRPQPQPYKPYAPARPYAPKPSRGY